MDFTQKGKQDKKWGFEIVWASNEKYCGKILVFEKKGAKTAMAMHKEKFKSWFVNSGKIRLNFIDTQTGQFRTSDLSEGMTFEAGPLAPYQAECLEDNTMIFEVGTPDYTSDRFFITDDETDKQNAGSQPKTT